MGLDNPLHIAFLVVILLLVFGAKRLPEIGRSLGSGMREFKDSVTGEAKQPPALNEAQPAQQPAQPQQTQQAAPAQPPVPAQQPAQAPAEPSHQ
jgi:sec-independent protein translocase protein TatA